MGVRSYEYNLNEFYLENRLINFTMYQQAVDKNDLIIIRNKMENAFKNTDLTYDNHSEVLSLAIPKTAC